MRHGLIDSALFTRNRDKIAGIMPPGSLAIINTAELMPRNGDQFHKFRQNSDFFYLTGLEIREGHLLIFPDHPDPSRREVLFIPDRDEVAEKWEGRRISPEKASKLSGLDNVHWLSEFPPMLRSMVQPADEILLNRIEYFKFSTNVPYKDLRFISWIKEEYPLHKVGRLAPLLEKCRLIKDELEISLLRKACGITGRAFNNILKEVKPGMMEYEIEAAITYEFIRSGASGHAYAPIIASGENACILHYTGNSCKIQDGDLLLMDFGAEYANYAADLSRTIPVNGKFSKRQKDCYMAVLNVQKELIPMFVPGKSINEIHKAACEVIGKEMIGLGLFSLEDVKKQDVKNPLWFRYYFHGTSHFLGLDVHDVGQKDTIFEKGMVLSCEPAIYIPGENIGIRIENDIVVDDIPVDLMKDIPREPGEIEEIMNSK